MTTEAPGKTNMPRGKNKLRRKRVRLLLGAHEPPLAHFVAINAKRIGNARSELLRLLQKRCECRGFHRPVCGATG